MFCKNCGAQIEANAAFCKECGTKVENMEEVRKSTASRMKRDYFKTGGIAASLLLFFSALLPYYKVTDKRVASGLGFSSFSLLKAEDTFLGDWIIMLILIVLLVLMICLNKKMVALILGILNLGLCGVKMIMFKDQMSEFKKQLRGVMNVNDVFSKGVGYYMLRIACVIFLAALLLYVFKKREIESSNCQ